MQIPLRNMTGEEVGTLDASDEVFGAPVNEALIHQAVLAYLANQRLGTHKTKTRGEVSGGGAKPWRQKSTGRARQGSRVSPLWRGGGTVFGPEPRGYKQQLPKKMARGAMRSGLSSRMAEGAVIGLDRLALENPRTREMVNALASLAVSGSVVVVDEAPESNAHLAGRNLPDVSLRDAVSLNLMDVLQPEHLVLTQAAIRVLERRLATGAGEAS